MPVVSQGSLKPEYFADLKGFLNPDLSEDQGWADLSRAEIVATLSISKEEATSLLIEINSQLARTGKAWDSKESEHLDCPNADLLVLMLNKYPRIKDLGDPDTVGMDQVTSDFRDMDQDQVIAVINWCRRFFGIPGGGVFAELKPGSTFTHGGRIVQGDLDDSTTNAGTARSTQPTPPTPPKPPNVPSGAGKTVFNFAGGLTGRVDASGEFIKVRGQDYDPTSEEHRGFALKYGYDLKTGKKK